MVLMQTEILSNDRLFECLCSDLGVKIVASATDHQLGELKDEFLRLAENEFKNTAANEWFSKWSSYFDLPGLTAQTVSSVVGFRTIYQVLCFRLKIERPTTKLQEELYIKKFLDTEKVTKAWKVNPQNEVSRLAKWLIRRTFMNLDLSAKAVKPFARHGPGATYDKEVGDDKNVFVIPSDQLGRYVQWDEFFANESLWAEWVQNGFGGLYLRAEYPSSRKRFNECRLTLVPKSYKGPRGVFISSKEAMFWQLGIDGKLKDYLEGTWINQCYKASTQEPSRVAAYAGSYDRHQATLDLSDASDRIPLSLVAYLFHRQHYLALANTRPTYAWLPSGERHRLGMLSPMGDGKTFPCLTIISATLAVCATLKALGYVAARPPSMEVVWGVARSIRVFGDDIIVDAQYFDAVVEALENHNLKVNVSKSFVHGYFRESCGMDAYRGTDVTPIRQKVDLESESPDLVKLIEFHNRVAHLKGWTKTAHELSSIIRAGWGSDVGLTTNYKAHPLCLWVPWGAQGRYILPSQERTETKRPKPGEKRPCAWVPTLASCDPWRTWVFKSGEREVRVPGCVRCRYWGLIILLNRLRIQWRYNARSQRIEQRVLTLVPVTYPESLDGWWRLNGILYSTHTTGCESPDPTDRTEEVPFYKVRRQVVGSPEAQKALDKWCRIVGLKRERVRATGLQLRWVAVS